MKTLISKTKELNISKWGGIKKSSLSVTFIFVLLSFIFLSSTPVTPEYQVKNDAGKNKKLMILEKLETGKDISKEEIRTSFNDFRFNDSEYEIIFGNDFRKINNQISESMKELKKNIGSFHNSEEFLSMHEDLLRWNEKFKDDFEKMMQELKHSTREKKGSVPITPDSYRDWSYRKGKNN